MNIAIVDNQLMFGELLAEYLKKSLTFSQCQVFSKPMSFLDFDFRQWQPDLVIFDIRMAEIGGLDMLTRAKPLLGKHCKFVVVTSLVDLNLVKNAMQKGVHGYVEKNASLNELLQAIQEVMQGSQYICQSLKDNLLTYMLADDPTKNSLSSLENDVLQRICAGYSLKEITLDLNLSLHTVQQYNKNLLRKFSVQRTADLMAYAFKEGLVKPVV